MIKNNKKYIKKVCFFIKISIFINRKRQDNKLIFNKEWIRK